MAERLLTIEELAALVHTTPEAIHTQRYRTGEPKGVKVGRRVMFRDEDVRRWLDGHAEHGKARRS